MTDITEQSVLKLHNRVSVRPEPFGALLYHFGTRRLSFLKSPSLLAVVDALADDRTVADALDIAEVPDAMLAAMLRAFTTLRDSEMLVEVAV